jgi:hypothetical protein
LQLRGMSQDFSWHASALAYQQLYEDARQTVTAAAAKLATTTSPEQLAIAPVSSMPPTLDPIATQATRKPA